MRFVLALLAGCGGPSDRPTGGPGPSTSGETEVIGETSSPGSTTDSVRIDTEPGRTDTHASFVPTDSSKVVTDTSAAHTATRSDTGDTAHADTARTDTAASDTAVTDTGTTCERVSSDQCGRRDWLMHIHSRAEDSLAGAAIAPDGTLVLGGWAMRDIVFAEGQPTETVVQPTCGGSDAPFLARMNTDGSMLWARRVADGCDSIRIQTVRVLPDNSIAIGGWFHDTATFGAGTPVETTLTTDGDRENNLFFARFDADGNSLWAKQTIGGNSDLVEAMAVTEDGGQLMFGGSFQDRITFGAGTPEELTMESQPDVYGYQRDAYVASYRVDGGFRWVRQVQSYDIVSNENVEAMVTVPGGVLLVAIRDDGTRPIVFERGTSAELVLHPSKELGIPIASYALDGTFLGAVLTPGGNAAALVRADDDYVLAGRTSVETVLGSGQPNETTLDVYATFLARYDAQHRLKWVGASESGPPFPKAAAASTHGFAIGGGYTREVAFPCPTMLFPEVNLQDAFAVRYDADGALQCAWAMPGVRDQNVTMTAFDQDGGLLVGGFFRNEIIIGLGTPQEVTLVADNDSTDLFLMRLLP